MNPVSIHAELKRVLPGLTLGCVSATVKVEKHSEAVWKEIDRHLAQLTSTYKTEQISVIPQIAAMRSAYKALGKDPSRYRGSAEALLRRVISGKGLFQVNNIVDINNLVSLESFLPLGSYDMESLSGAVELRIGGAGETYKGIGKDDINIEILPVFADRKGPFGSPTSDSERAMVRLDTRRILMAIFSLIGPSELESNMARCRTLLAAHAGAGEIESSIIA